MLVDDGCVVEDVDVEAVLVDDEGVDDVVRGDGVDVLVDGEVDDVEVVVDDVG